MAEPTTNPTGSADNEYGEDHRPVSAYAVTALVFALVTWYSQLFGKEPSGRFAGLLACAAGVVLSVWLALRLLKDKRWELKEKIVLRSFMAFPVYVVIGVAVLFWFSRLGLADRAPANVILVLTALYVACCLIGVFLLVRVETHLTLTSFPTFRPRVLYGIMVGLPFFFLTAVAGFSVMYGVGPHVVAWITGVLGVVGVGAVAASDGERRGWGWSIAAIAASAAFLSFVPSGPFPG